MNIYTSYFAQLRNFPKNLIGLSTAAWNPKWRPMGKDKRGVICIDIHEFKPGESCEGLCNGSCNPKHPQDCKFLKAYAAQLNALDFKDIYNRLENLKKRICVGEHLDDVDFAFIVYETPNNECSERWAIQKYFLDNGIQVREWSNHKVENLKK